MCKMRAPGDQPTAKKIQSVPSAHDLHGPQMMGRACKELGAMWIYVCRAYSTSNFVDASKSLCRYKLATVHVNDSTIDETGLFRRQEGDSFSDVFWMSKPSHRNAFEG